MTPDALVPDGGSFGIIPYMMNLRESPSHGTCRPTKARPRFLSAEMDMRPHRRRRVWRSLRGTSAAANPWRFSSEYAEDDTATVYYNYRHYEPKMGRWLNRDRIEERGGVKLYAAFENDPVYQFDSEGDVVVEVILAALLAELANHYVCDWYAHDGLDNETDTYKHCMVSCRYSKCTSILNGQLIAAINTFLGGVVHEIVSSNNS